jgi:hypothetical protein
MYDWEKERLKNFGRSIYIHNIMIVDQREAIKRALDSIVWNAEQLLLYGHAIRCGCGMEFKYAAQIKDHVNEYHSSLIIDGVPMEDFKPPSYDSPSEKP